MQRKDAGMRIRIERDLRDTFVEVCRSQDLAASEVLREFMLRYVQHLNPQPGQLALPLNSDNKLE